MSKHKHSIVAGDESLCQTFNDSAENERGHIKTIKIFSDGFTIVELLDPKALRYVGHELDNCFKKGEYDTLIGNGSRRVFCLRDQNLKTHINFDVTSKNLLVQCKGRTNQVPSKKYTPYIVEFLREQKFIPEQTVNRSGFLYKRGEYYNIRQLPKNFICGHTIDLTKTDLTILPANLTVVGDLILKDTPIKTLPENLVVEENLNICRTRITILPASLKAHVLITETPEKFKGDFVAYMPTDYPYK